MNGVTQDKHLKINKNINKKYSTEKFLQMSTSVVQKKITCTIITNIVADSTPDTVQRQQASNTTHINIP